MAERQPTKSEPVEQVFIDAKCPKCGAHIGWHGRVVDRPSCRRCGDRPNDSELLADQEELDNFREFLREMRGANPGWDKWRKARLAAGFGLRRAAKLLDITPSDLSEIERGETIPSEDLARRMTECYSHQPARDVNDE